MFLKKFLLVMIFILIAIIAIAGYLFFAKQQPALAAGNIINAASCEQADVQTAINQAVDGDTVIVPAGSCMWTTMVTVPNTKGIAISGAGIDQTIITDDTSISNPLNRLFDISCLNVNAPTRLTGFTIKDTGKTDSNAIFAIFGCNNFRIDHNKFENLSSRTMWLGTPNSPATYGIIDHNIFIHNIIGTYQGISVMGNGDISWNTPQSLGSENAVYVEDNTFSFTNMGDGALDAYNGARYVFRHNVVNGTNVGHHGLDSGGYRSVHSFEIYNNTFENLGTHIFTAMNFRGGSGVVFNNTISANGGSYDVFAYLRNYRSDSGYVASWGVCDGANPIDGNELGGEGYPCKDQIGRTSNQALFPVYSWNNMYKNNSSPVFSVGGYADHTRAKIYHIIENRDFYNNTPRLNYIPYTYPHPLIATTSKKGDFNFDDRINDLDFTDFKNAFKSIFNSLFDLNSDSVIDVKDLGVLMSSWLP